MVTEPMRNLNNSIRIKDLLERIKNNPELPLSEITAILVEAIVAYIEKAIDLKTLASVANEIKNNIKTPLSREVKSAIAEINSIQVVDDVLVDILDELTEK